MGMVPDFIKIENFSFEEEERYNNSLAFSIHEVCKVGKDKFCLPKGIDYNWIRNEMPVYSDDLWIVTPPKCGTTWMQEIIWLIHTNVDLEKAKSDQFFRIPFMELGFLRPNFTGCPKPDFETTEKSEATIEGFMSHSFEYVLSLKRPRIIKTHLPLQLLPRKLLQTAKVSLLLL